MNETATLLARQLLGLWADLEEVRRWMERQKRYEEYRGAVSGLMDLYVKATTKGGTEADKAMDKAVEK